MIYDLRRDTLNEARLIYARKYGEIAPQKGCLYWAAAFNEAAQSAGMDSVIQAGSAMFQFRDDDGESVTHFSYMFEAPAAIDRMTRGLFPEIHAWNYLRATGEVVDMAIQFQKQQARDLLGFVWQKEYELPSIYWQKPVGTRIIYRADPVATYICFKVLKKFDQRSKSAVAELSECANIEA